jgi:hypothetical protein
MAKKFRMPPLKSYAKDAGAHKGIKSETEEVVTVYGDFTDRISTIKSVLASLVLGIGYIEKKGESFPVLIPSIEVKLGVESAEKVGDDKSREFSTSIMLDNVAFLVSSLAESLFRTTDELLVVSSSGIQPVSLSVTQSLEYLKKAEKSIHRCCETLEILSQRRSAEEQLKKKNLIDGVRLFAAIPQRVLLHPNQPWLSPSRRHARA